MLRKMHYFFGLYVFGSLSMIACGTPIDTMLETREIISDPLIVRSGASPAPDVLAAGALVSVDADGITSKELQCSGTLIAPNVVLTAAHCFVNEATDDTTDLARNLYFTLEQKATGVHLFRAFPVQQITVHPEYDSFSARPLEEREPQNEQEQAVVAEVNARCGDPTTITTYSAGKQRWACILNLPASLLFAFDYTAEVNARHDIAVAILRDPVHHVEPAQLPRFAAQLSSQEELIIAGYGTYTDWGFGIRFSGLRRQGHATVDAQSRAEMRVTYDQAQACFGDSGGPLLRSTASGMQIVGVASRGSFDRLTNHCWGPAIYTRVDAHVRWILGVIQVTK